MDQSLPAYITNAPDGYYLSRARAVSYLLDETQLSSNLAQYTQ